MLKINDARGEQIAMIVNVSEFQSGYSFLSDGNWGLQIGVNLYDAGSRCAPHEHLGKSNDDLRALIGQAMEVLYIVEGRCEIDIFSTDRQLLNTSVVESGDIVIFIKGWHGLRFLTKTKIMECKQGPYINREKDKRFLEL
jgi:hypothetical protein